MSEWKKLYEHETQRIDDPVNHPQHYTRGNIECIDMIEDILGEKGFIGYLKGNIIKYLYREEDKNGLEDLEKAKWYLNRLIDARG